jgi:hypothetical protein
MSEPDGAAGNGAEHTGERIDHERLRRPTEEAAWSRGDCAREPIAESAEELARQ